MNRYRIKLRHDGGTVALVTAASSQRAAVAQVLAAERAPRIAVLEVTDLGPVPW